MNNKIFYSFKCSLVINDPQRLTLNVEPSVYVFNEQKKNVLSLSPTSIKDFSFNDIKLNLLFEEKFANSIGLSLVDLIHSIESKVKVLEYEIKTSNIKYIFETLRVKENNLQYMIFNVYSYPEIKPIFLDRKRITDYEIELREKILKKLISVEIKALPLFFTKT